MPRILTPREEEIMQVLWKLKKAFVKEIIEELPPPAPPYNTVSSVIRKLEKEEMIGHRAFGHTHQYFPILKKAEYRRKMLGKLVQEYFSSSPENLLSHFVREENLDPEELKELIDRIQEEE